jgi:homoserine kinase type II
MAVYTEVSDEELARFIASYRVGALLSFKGIAEGVENTNYLVHTEAGPFSSRSMKSAWHRRICRFFWA